MPCAATPRCSRAATRSRRSGRSSRPSSRRGPSCRPRASRTMRQARMGRSRPRSCSSAPAIAGCRSRPGKSGKPAAGALGAPLHPRTPTAGVLGTPLGAPLFRRLPVPAERFHLAGAEVLVGADIEETARIAAGQFTAAARSIAGEGKPFHVAFSGGNSPRPLFQLLATEPFRQLVPWETIQFFWADERKVPPGDPESNYSMARELLLGHVRVPATHIHRIPTGDGTAIEAADLYQRTL